MDDTTDLLQVKIEKAKTELSEDTLAAIGAVPWQAHILEMRETRGYTFEQLGDLEIETELLLCGLVSSENYPHELQSRLHLTESQTKELVNDMNEKVFQKIKEELIKITESEKGLPTRARAETTPVKIKIVSPFFPAVVESDEKPTEIKKEVLKPIEKESPSVTTSVKIKEEPHPILIQKLSAPVQNQPTTTEHTLESITKATPTSYAKDEDPYRMKPE